MAGFKKRTTPAQAHILTQKANELTALRTNAETPQTEPTNLPSFWGVGEGEGSKLQRAAVGTVIEVPVKAVRENPFNARTMLTASSIDEMATSLVEGGQKSPAAAFYDTDGVVTLIDGHRRLRGLIAAGLTHLRVEIRPEPATDIDKYLESRKFNVDREDQTPIDDAFAWKRMLSLGVVASQDEIVARLAVSKSTVSKILSLAELPSPVTAALVEQRDLLNLSTLYEIYLYWKTVGDEKTLELVAEAASRGYSRREIEARRKSAERGPKQRPRSQRWKFSYGGANGVLRRFDADGRVELRIQGLKTDDVDALERKLAELVSAEPELSL